MKSNKLFFGALTLLAFTACSDDKNNEPISEQDGPLAYVKVSVMTTSPGSRADEEPLVPGTDFEDGTDGTNNTVNENTIGKVVLVFYDENRNYIGDATLTESDLTMTSGNPSDEPATNIEKYGTGIAEVSLGGVTPKYMMAFANPISEGNIKTGVDVVKLQERETYKTTLGFTMNNSVYFNASGEIQRAVPIDAEKQIFTSKGEATKATGKGIITVWLDRLAAKVSLSGSGTNGAITERTGTLDEKQLKFVVEGWGLNVTAKKMYLSKYFNLTNGSTYNSINERLSTFTWNDYQRHRSYWAFSPAYDKTDNFKSVTKEGETEATKIYGTDFPYVADQVTADSKFNYYPFKSFLPKKEGETDAIKGTHCKAVGATEYTLENTVSSAIYAKSCDYRNSALVAAVVVGHYELGGTQQSFYVRNEKIYLEEDFKKEMAIIAGGYLVDEHGNALNKDNYTSGLFTIYHPTETSSTKGVQENRVTVKLTSVTAANGIKYKANSTTEAVAITTENINDINTKLYEVCGLSYAYTNGYAYFNIPIEHLGVTPKNAENPVAGSFGIVRNHHYDLSVTGWADLSFATLGTGVFDPDEPVVPPTDPSDKIAVKAEMRVLTWRLVSKEVTLGQ